MADYSFPMWPALCAGYPCLGPRASQYQDMCRQCLAACVDQADAHGDGALVNALCELGRRKFGPGLRW